MLNPYSKMIRNPNAQWQEDARRESYEKLKALISSKEGDKMNEFYQAYMHIVMMEHKLAEQEKEIKQYRGFFANLSALLPHKFTEIIG